MLSELQAPIASITRAGVGQVSRVAVAAHAAFHRPPNVLATFAFVRAAITDRTGALQ